MACKDCVSGALHEGTPTGKVLTVHSLPTYVADAPGGDAKGVVVIIPDAFGWEFPNNRILADNLAKKLEMTVYLPEFMQGNAVAPEVVDKMEVATDATNGMMKRMSQGFGAATGFIPFLVKTRESVTAPIIQKFFQGVREATTLPIGAAGYCWGGKFTIDLCSGKIADKAENGEPKFLVECGYTAHPSNIKFPDDINALKLPLAIGIGTEDVMMKTPQVQQTQSIFKTSKSDCELVTYDGAKHGFAVRADPKDEKATKQGVEAEDQAVNWFKKYLVAKPAA